MITFTLLVVFVFLSTGYLLWLASLAIGTDNDWLDRIGGVLVAIGSLIILWCFIGIILLPRELAYLPF